MLSMSYPRHVSTTQTTLKLATLLLSSLLTVTACSNSNSNNDSPANNSSSSSNIQTVTEISNDSAEPTNEQTTAADETTNADMPTYVVATDKDFKPFGFRGTDAQIIGFDIDVLNAIAADQHMQFTYIEVPFNEQFAGLTQNNFDIIASGLSITDERQKNMKFSSSYFTSRQAVLTLPSKPKINDFEDLTSYRVSAIENTTSAKLLTNQLKLQPSNIVYVVTPYNGIESVIQERADYTMGDSPVLQYYAKQLKDFNLKVYIDSSYEPEYYGFAVAKNRDDDLIQKINTGLDNIKADGTYKQLTNKWFIN